MPEPIVADPTKAEPTSPVNADGSFTENWHGKYGEENSAHLSRYKTFDDLVNSTVATKKKFGKDPNSLVEIPTEHSSDEVRAAFRKAKGTPDSVDAYEYTLSDEMAVKLGPVDDVKMTAFRDFAHKQEWSPRQFKDALDFYHTNISSDIDAFGETHTAQRTETAEKNKAELKKEWLGDYQTNVDDAQNIMEVYGGVDAVAELDLQNSPTLIKFLHNISKHMSPDPIKGKGPAGGMTKANIKARIDENRVQMNTIMKENPINYRNDAKFRELDKSNIELYKQFPA